MIFLSKGVIFRFHVNFLGGKHVMVMFEYSSDLHVERFPGGSKSEWQEGWGHENTPKNVGLVNIGRVIPQECPNIA